MKKLKIVYNNGPQRLLNLAKYNSDSEIFVNLNVPSFDELLRKFVFSFKSWIMNSDNLLVNAIVRSGGVTFSTYNYIIYYLFICVGIITGFFRLILIYFNMTVVCVLCAVCFINVLLWNSSLSINIYIIILYYCSTYISPNTSFTQVFTGFINVYIKKSCDKTHTVCHLKLA